MYEDCAYVRARGDSSEICGQLGHVSDQLAEAGELGGGSAGAEDCDDRGGSETHIDFWFRRWEEVWWFV